MSPGLQSSSDSSDGRLQVLCGSPALQQVPGPDHHLAGDVPAHYRSAERTQEDQGDHLGRERRERSWLTDWLALIFQAESSYRLQHPEQFPVRPTPVQTEAEIVIKHQHQPRCQREKPTPQPLSPPTAAASLAQRGGPRGPGGGGGSDWRSELECPVCLEEMVEVRIHQCVSGHLVCHHCRQSLQTCPVCRDNIIGRATVMERLASALFSESASVQ